MKNFVYLTYLNFICTSDMHEIEHIYIYEIQINTNDLLYRTWKLCIYIYYTWNIFAGHSECEHALAG